MIWKTIPDCVNLYQVSDCGEIRVSMDYGWKTKSQVFDVRGYQITGLVTNLGPKRVYVHRLVAQAFIPNPDKLPCINHKNHNKSDNNHTNLEWCTHKQNSKAAELFGLIHAEKPVEQVDPISNRIISVFDSHTQAAERTGCAQGNISMAVRRGWLHNGFIWRDLT